MRTVSLRSAKRRLSRLLRQAAAGQEFIIAKDGKPIARLRPLAPEPRQRGLGRVRGQIVVPDDFDDPLPDDVLSLFVEWSSEADRIGYRDL